MMMRLLRGSLPVWPPEGFSNGPLSVIASGLVVVLCPLADKAKERFTWPLSIGVCPEKVSLSSDSALPEEPPQAESRHTHEVRASSATAARTVVFVKSALNAETQSEHCNVCCATERE